ncbi:MAG TPA: Asp-tRNA(Asn)/Glu-tRNA(Gln) amidotransferase subunit GatC [Burkholderiales bacterium]|jgi:aspartyl-tRNA(Asn)/glutamyl-tRNA(Gln) amidotransferase subunit C|nr:Asp-tRNA(Asn)/Glu-tRNA(Gln) amidotransferase subunit GatC [Burkholderiales bacterium]
MALSLDDVKRVAHLARIEISDVAAQSVLRDLDRIFALIEEMQAVDVSGIEPMAHGQDVVLPLREDKVTETDQHALFQSVAPQVEAGLYLVPKVIE